jgi:alpha-glucosidase
LNQPVQSICGYGGVIYNAYPRSWQDSNHDGVGDLRGIVQRLDHLAWLGVDGLWLNPIFPSPNLDWGYDVSNFCNVHPDFGTLDDLDMLVAEARRRGIGVILDLVPCHTSDKHPWFEEARRSPASRFRDYYVWRPGRSGNKAPTNWRSYFGGSAWTLDEHTGEYYLHNFSTHQPQLNWWNPEVVAEFDRIYRFWFDRGVAGFRIDALQTLFYDNALRDNPAATVNDTVKERELQQRFVFNANRPEVHDIIRRWRRLADSYDPPRLLFGETWVPTIERLAAYYGNGRDELHLGWNLPFLTSRFRADDLAQVIRQTIETLPSGAVPAWAMSTHDGEGRAASRWCNGDEAAIRCALLVLLGLEGTSILYYGDEIGMLEPPRHVLDAEQRYPAEKRFASRTPMPWGRGAGGGFSTGRPWLPVGDTARTNVADQMGDPGSVLHFCRDLIAVRARLPSGRMRVMIPTDGMLAWRRGNATVAVNLGTSRADVSADGSIVIATNRQREGERVAGVLTLSPKEGAIVF